MKSSNSPATTSSALQSLTTKFNQWRATRVNRRSRVPKPLRDRAVALLELYPKAKIIKALGINSNMFKSWQDPEPLESPSNDFVPMVMSSPSIPSSPLEFTLSYPEGHEVTLRGDFSSEQLTALMRGLGTTGEARV